MIYLYSGTPGSGKSLHVASVIKSWIHKWKAPVVGNFEFNGLACKPRGYGSYLKCDNDNLTPEFCFNFSDQYRKERGWDRVPEEEILLVIDECQILFNARSWNEDGRTDWIRFFTQHRKLGYRIILIAQFDQMIDRQIRSLIEYEFLHRKVKNIGKGGWILNFLSGGGLHVCVKIYKPLNEKVGSEFTKADKKLFALYDSYVIFDESPDLGAQQAFMPAEHLEPETHQKQILQ